MRLAVSPVFLQAGRVEREAKLKEFISAGVCEEITIIARATDSPAACALAALMQERGKSAVNVRAILLETDGAPDDGRPTLFDIKGVEVRVFNDQRFASAHEQIVAGENHSWIGDCMRRDPAKRDAFEVYHHDDASAARHAAVSFSRLWKIAKPAKRAKPLKTDVVIAGQKTAKQERRPASRR